MRTQDLKTQVFHTASQWQSGLLVRLDAPEPAGITLLSSPQFVKLIAAKLAQKSVMGLAVDACRQIYWIDHNSGWLYRFDPQSNQQELLIRLFDYTRQPGKMLLHDRTLWILDHDRQRVLAFSREYFQLKYVIGTTTSIIDMAFDGDQFMYLLEQDGDDKFYLKSYDVNGLPAPDPFQPAFRDPQGLAVSRASTFYVIDKITDAAGQERWGFHQFSSASDATSTAFPNELRNLEPTCIHIDQSDNIFVATRETTPAEQSPLHQFSPDGSYLGEVSLPSCIRTVDSITFGAPGEVYLGTDQGLAYLNLQTNLVGQTGVYYSRTLDNGQHQGTWHRMRLQAELPPGANIEVQYYASDEEGLKTAIDNLLSNAGISQQEKETRLKQWLGTKWRAAEVFTGQVGSESLHGASGSLAADRPQNSSQTLHLLFQHHIGRYLWLRLELSTFDEQHKPAITDMRVYYPRLSYLRFLPAIYQEDAVSKAFLEKFLALFETVFHGLGLEIDHIFKYFDPKVTPPEFLDWLSTWLHFALQEAWSETLKRRFLCRANALFKRKGTPAGLAEFIEMYTGRIPIIVEDARVANPMLLVHSPGDLGSRAFRVGLDSIVKRAPVRGFRLGDDAILGSTAVRDVVQTPDEPFGQTAHRFTVFLNMDQQAYARLEPGLRRIISEQKPAHTAYRIRLLGDAASTPSHYIGLSSQLTDFRPFRLGVDSRLGQAVAVIQQPEGVLLERNSRLTWGLRLI